MSEPIHLNVFSPADIAGVVLSIVAFASAKDAETKATIEAAKRGAEQVAKIVPKHEYDPFCTCEECTKPITAEERKAAAEWFASCRPISHLMTDDDIEAIDSEEEANV